MHVTSIHNLDFVLAVLEWFRDVAQCLTQNFSNFLMIDGSLQRVSSVCHIIKSVKVYLKAATEQRTVFFFLPNLLGGLFCGA